MHVFRLRAPNAANALSSFTVRRLMALTFAVAASIAPRSSSAQEPPVDHAQPIDRSTPDPATPAAPAQPPPRAPAQAPPPSPAPVPSPAPLPRGAPDEELGMSIGASRPTDMAAFAAQSEQELKVGSARARYSLNIFGDVGVAATVGTRRDFNPTFSAGTFSLLFNGNLDGGFRMVAEPAIEFNEANEPGIDLERLALRWTRGGFFIEAGRTHLDIGYWNTAYHHGKWLQPTVDRPRLVRFEDSGGILPIHWVGLTAGYGIDLGKGMSALASLSLGNSRGPIVDSIQNRVDGSADKQLSAKIELKGLLHKELRLGISGVHGKIAAQDAMARPSLPGARLIENIGNVYVALPAQPFYALAEGYAITHAAQARSWETYGGFVTVGYAFDIVTPYILAERLVTTNGVDPFFMPDPRAVSLVQLDVVDGVGGVRLDVSTWSSLKVEYRLTRLVDLQETVHSGTASWQFAL